MRMWSCWKLNLILQKKILLNILFRNKRKKMLQRKVQVVWEWEVVMMENNRKTNKLLKNPEERK
jgi:hypothetical protein